MSVNAISRPGPGHEDHGWPSPPDPGDLSRRIAQRRTELHLSQAQLAARAGVSLRYLEYLERYPARPSQATLRQLAAALRTTPAVLLGGGMNMPPGQCRPAGLRAITKLMPAECRRLIAPGGVGRIAFGTISGPIVVPVNFAVLADSIVIRTAEGTVIDGHAGEQVGRGALAGRHVRAPAEQHGGRGPQRGGELPERGRAGPGRVPFHVLQVTQAQPGARRHLRLAQVKFGAPLCDPPAQVARVGGGRPAVVFVPGSRPGYGVNGHRYRDALRGTASPPRLFQRVRRGFTPPSPTLSRVKPGGECPPPRPDGTFVHRCRAGPWSGWPGTSGPGSDAAAGAC